MSAMPHKETNVDVSAHSDLPGRPVGALRAAAVKEAMIWIGPPFHHAARVKGAESTA